MLDTEGLRRRQAEHKILSTELARVLRERPELHLLDRFKIVKARLGSRLPRSLTQEEVDSLPEGTPVLVRWSGGNGPHRYTIGVRHNHVCSKVVDNRIEYLERDARYALWEHHPSIDRHADPDWRFDCQPDLLLWNVGPETTTHVWLVTED